MDKTQFEAMIDVAIEREIEAYEFYSKVAATLSNKGLVVIFQELAGEEEGHRKLLESFKEKAELHFTFKNPSNNYHIAEQTELPRLTTDMKPADAFALAMKKEQQAAEFYQDLANRSSDTEIQQMCLNLAKMELGHKTKLEAAYTDVAFVESF